jgi:lysophospholipase L1-like esterase
MAGSRTQVCAAGGKAGLAALIALALGAAAWGQEPAPVPVPLTKACQAGDATIATEHPLPNVAAALKDRKELRILAIGASGGRRGNRGSYTAQIEKLLEQANKGLDVVIINRGVSGELAADAARRIKIEVALTEPTLVLWQVGTNDALAYVPLEQIEETVTDTVRWLKAHKVDVVLVGLQFVHRMAQDEHYRAVRALMRKIAAQENVVIVRRYEAMELIARASGDDPTSVPDLFEQAESSYACLAQYVARAITIGIFGKGLRQRPPPAPAPR